MDVGCAKVLIVEAYLLIEASQLARADSEVYNQEALR